MAIFLNIAPGETRQDKGIRVHVREDGERVWMHGKWLELGEDHAVAWIDGRALFVKPDGKSIHPGEFPAWVVKSTRKNGPFAMMFNAAQFYGGELIIQKGRGKTTISIQGPGVAAKDSVAA